MRLLMIASGDLWAGAEVMVAELVRGLIDHDGIILRVVLLNHGRLADELRRTGVTVQIVDESKLSFFAIIGAVQREIASFSPEIIHSHRYKENFLAWLAHYNCSGVKLVATQHGMSEAPAEKRGCKSLLRTALFFRLLSCCFDRTVVVSDEMRRSLLGRYGFTEKHLIAIHNGTSLPEKVESRSGDYLQVGSAGRLFPVKDFQLLVEVANWVVEKNDAFRFVLAGDGPDRGKLQEKVKHYGLEERFCFLGHQDDMGSFYAGLDIYINTSVHEGIPMSVLEAMAHGLPVIAPKVGGLPEIVESEVSGYLIEGRKPERFGEKILELLDRNKRHVMSIEAKKRIMNCFSIDVMVRKYYQLYRDICRT